MDDIELIFYFGRYLGSILYLNNLILIFSWQLRNPRASVAHIRNLIVNGSIHVPYSIKISGFCLRQDLIWTQDVCPTPTLWVALLPLDQNPRDSFTCNIFIWNNELRYVRVVCIYAPQFHLLSLSYPYLKNNSVYFHLNITLLILTKLAVHVFNLIFTDSKINKMKYLLFSVISSKIMPIGNEMYALRVLMALLICPPGGTCT